MTRKRKETNGKAAHPAIHSEGASEKRATLSRRGVMLALGGAAIAGGFLLINSSPAMAKEVVVYKNPSCGCCSKWADYMRAAGFSVEVYAVNNMGDIKEVRQGFHVVSCVATSEKECSCEVQCRICLHIELNKCS